MGVNKDRNVKKQNRLKRGGKNTQKNYSKKCHNDPDNHDVVATHLEPDILDSEVKWALGRITLNKASGCDGIPAEVFKILKHDAVKMLHLICPQIWKNSNGHRAGKICFHSNPKEGQ